jgi:hypothetical protein
LSFRFVISSNHFSSALKMQVIRSMKRLVM